MQLYNRISTIVHRYGITAIKVLKRNFRNYKIVLGGLSHVSGYDIRSAEILEKLGWLTLEHRWHLNKALLMHKIANNDAPMYLTSQFSRRNQMHDYNVRGSQVNFSLPKPSTNFMKNSLAYSGAVTWNSLTDDIKSTEDVIAFKTKVSNNMRDSLSL